VTDFFCPLMSSNCSNCFRSSASISFYLQHCSSQGIVTFLVSSQATSLFQTNWRKLTETSAPLYKLIWKQTIVANFSMQLGINKLLRHYISAIMRYKRELKTQHWL